jgi:hypothetical protein
LGLHKRSHNMKNYIDFVLFLWVQYDDHCGVICRLVWPDTWATQRRGCYSGGRMPSRETLEAVDGYTLLRTDRDGWIELSTDGEQMWVEAAR